MATRHDPNTEPGRPTHRSTTGRTPAEGADPMVDHPTHYNSHPSGIETIDLVEHLSFNVGTAIRYLMRADHKGNRTQDLDKARWYLNREIDRLTRGGTPSTRAPESTWKALITGETDPQFRMIYRLIRSSTYIPTVAIIDGMLGDRVTKDPSV